MNPRLWLLPVMFSLWLSDSAFALGTEDVVRLHASGYTDDEINEVLSATQSEFLLSARDVVYLSQSGVGDPVVQNMLVALPLQPVNDDATAEAKPVRLLFTQEDLQLLAENHIPDPVVVTFIESRDMAFTLDTARLTALRDSGLGLDALQVLVEKSAANVSVPLAPPPAPPVVAGGGDSPSYFYGRSGNSLTSYSAPSYGTYYDVPSVYMQNTTFYPWYGYEFAPQYGYGYGFGSGFRGSGFGFVPQYVSYYPYAWTGFYGHSFYCPRDRHHYDGGYVAGGHHGRDDHGNHGNGHHQRDQDNDDHGQGRIFVARNRPASPNPAPRTGYYFGGNDRNDAVDAVSRNGVKSGIGSGQYVSGLGSAPNNNPTGGVYFGTANAPAVTKPAVPTGHYNVGKPYAPRVTTAVAGGTGTKAVVTPAPGVTGLGGKGFGGFAPADKNSDNSVTGLGAVPVGATVSYVVPQNGVAQGAAATQPNTAGVRPAFVRSAGWDAAPAGRAARFTDDTATDAAPAQRRRGRPP